MNRDNPWRTLTSPAMAVSGSRHNTDEAAAVAVDAVDAAGETVGTTEASVCAWRTEGCRLRRR